MYFAHWHCMSYLHLPGIWVDLMANNVSIMYCAVEWRNHHYGRHWPAWYNASVEVLGDVGIMLVHCVDMICSTYSWTSLWYYNFSPNITKDTPLFIYQGEVCSFLCESCYFNILLWYPVLWGGSVVIAVRFLLQQCPVKAWSITTQYCQYQAIAEVEHIESLPQGCSISSMLALEIPQSGIKPSIYHNLIWY